jgi:hypothetical protein
MLVDVYFVDAVDVDVDWDSSYGLHHRQNLNYGIPAQSIVFLLPPLFFLLHHFLLHLHLHHHLVFASRLTRSRTEKQCPY